VAAVSAGVMAERSSGRTITTQLPFEVSTPYAAQRACLARYCSFGSLFH
jgi:hypothetical protein